MSERIIRIGGASGFWGDSPEASMQLAQAGVDYIIFDYLAEVTMAIMARARAKDPALGYATDFVRPVMAALLPGLAGSGLKILANAGGMNPYACRDALQLLAGELGVTLKVAVITGDDVMPQFEAVRESGAREIDSGEALPEKAWSANAYLGAVPIAAALAAGADVVITGRCADSALALGPLIKEFGWSLEDYDRLAAGSLAGHIIECGCQATGGNFTDWRQVDGWNDMGFPIVECSADGSFVVTKAAGTGGLVSPLSVGEQVVYEIGDPQRYVLPDVVCDFTQVQLEAAGPDRVRISGARGTPPTDSYKVSSTFQDGYRCTAMFTLCGREAKAKAQRVADALLARTRRLFEQRGLGDYMRTSLKILGTEDQYGPHANPALQQSREVVLRLDVQHLEREAAAIFAREIPPAGLAMAPGRCGMMGRPNVQPVIGHAAFLLPKTSLTVLLDVDGERREISIPPGTAPSIATTSVAAGPTGPVYDGPTRRVPLYELACARSGDKGDSVNIGVIARDPRLLPVLRAELSAERVKDYLSHLVLGTVERWELPGMNAFNFLLRQALAGGGTRSLRNDPQGKTFAQMLLDIELDVPVQLLPLPAQSD